MIRHSTTAVKTTASVVIVCGQIPRKPTRRSDATTPSINLTPAICHAANAKTVSMRVGGTLPSAHSKLRST